MTAGTLAPYLGDGPAAVAARAELRAAARAGARATLACDRSRGFRRSLEAVLDAAYPAWYRQLFYSPDQRSEE